MPHARALLLTLCACVPETFTYRDAAPDDASDAAIGACTADMPFIGTGDLVYGTGTSSQAYPRLFSIGGETYMYFSRPADHLSGDLFYVKPVAGSFTGAAALPLFSVNGPWNDEAPHVVAPAGVQIYFHSSRGRDGGSGNDVFRGTGTGTQPDSFGQIATVAGADTPADEREPFFFDTNLYFASNRAVDGGAKDFDIFVIPATGGTAQLVPNVNSTGDDNAPLLSSDGTTMYLARRNGTNLLDIAFATRPTKQGTFGAPTFVGSLNTSNDEVPGWLSDDGCVLYFSRQTGTSGQHYIFIAKKR